MRERGLVAWIDDEAIDPGTPDWETSIRNAVTDAFATVLLSSPATVESQYVQAELKLAQKLGRPIVPVWTKGDDWLDCVPLALVNTQYVDCRGDQFDPGAERLVAQLRKFVAQELPKICVIATLNECPVGFLPIVVAKNDGETLDLYTAGHVVEWEHGFGDPFRENLQVIAANPHSYDSLEQLLNDLYSKYLRQRYTEYTYGRDWVLARPSTYVSLLALPWQWLLHKRQRLLIDVIDNYLERSTPLHSYGLDRNVWAIVDGAFDSAYGLWTSNDHAIAKVFNDHPKSLSFTLRRCQRSKPRRSTSAGFPTGFYRLDQLNPDTYAHKVVIVPGHFSDPHDDDVLVIEEIPLD
jgi:hypothetical protein